MRAFCGYITMYFHNDLPSSATIDFYKDPHHIASFVAYLRGRGVQKGAIIKHISLAMKVNFYLNYLSSSNNLHNFAHYSQMDEWFTTIMDRQFNQVMPPPKPFSTKHNIDGDLVLRWAIELGSNAIHLVDKDMLTNDGLLTHTTCMWVQRALIASLVVGAHIPPCRLNLLKTWNHPHLVDMLKCTDEGCRMGKECLGNYLSIVPFSGGEEEWEDEEEEEWPFFDYGAVSIKSVVVHGKTDRRGTGCALEYTLPRGDITKLLLAHITQGHAILTLEKDPPPIRFFVSNAGNAFNDSTFDHYWENLLQKCPISIQMGVPHFPQGSARRMFVEEYTSARGVEPDMWDGAALIMGNSTKTWEKIYNPSRKHRLAQGSVDAHKDYIKKRYNNNNTTIPFVVSTTDGDDDRR